MTVADIDGVHEATNLPTLETILMRRHRDSYNSFWLSHGDDNYPTLAILVKGDLATLNYIPKEFDAGFWSIGGIRDLAPDGSTAFPISIYPSDDVFVLNDAVLPFAVALQVAKEFFLSSDLPQSIDWRQL